MKTKLTFLTLTVLALFTMLSTLNAQEVVTQIGTGTSGSTSASNVYGTYKGGSKIQSIYTAAELTAAGMVAGDITSIGFYVKTSKGITVSDFSIYIGTTTQTVASSTFITGLTQVLGPISYAESAGLNTHTLTTAFTWDGVSSIVVGTESTYSNVSQANPQTRYTSTSDYLSVGYYGSSPLTQTSGTTSKKRTNVYFGVSPLKANELAVESWDTPNNPTLPSATPSVSVTILNKGTVDQTSCDISFSTDGGVNYTTETYTGTIAAGASYNHTFATPISLSAGIYDCKASVYIAGDELTNNDTLAYTLYVGDPLAGVYTVGTGVNDDYATINDFVFDLNMYGVSGPVTANLAAETFNEQVAITGPIAGMSATNTLTFKGHGTSTLINCETNGLDNRDVLKIIDQDYITLDSLSITSTSLTDNNIQTSYTTAILLSNSNNITVKNCNITLPITTSANTNGIIVSGSSTSVSNATTANNIVIENNTITNGYYALCATGASSHSSNIIVKNNTFNNYYYSGIYFDNQDSLTITNNTLVERGGKTSSLGIYVEASSLGSTIANNSIVAKSTETGSALSLINCEATVANPYMVYNNMITANNSTGTFYGINVDEGINLKFYYNTSSLYAGGASSAALNVVGNTSTSSMSNVEFENNIFSNKGDGYAVLMDGIYYPTNITVMDYNDLYSESASVFANMGSEYADLASWQAAVTGLDLNSISTDPLTYSPINGHSSSSVMDNKGTYISSVLYDIDGELRDVTTPDMGADEYSPLTDDVAIIEVSTITGADMAHGVKTPITVKVANFGTTDLTSLPFAWSIDNGTTVNYDTIAVVLNSTDTVEVTLTDSLYFYSIRQNEVKIAVDVAIDENRGNDTVAISVLSCVPFNGSYTMGGAGAELESFTHTLEMINYAGVTGPVVINVNPGVYNEQLVIYAITSLSSINSLTFQSASGNNADVLLEYVPTTKTSNYIVKLDGADNITFKDMSFSTASAGEYARIFHFEDNADTNTIIGCSLMGKKQDDPSSVGSYDYGDMGTCALIYAYGDENNANTFESNTFKDCYSAAYWIGGGTSSLGENNVFKNNTISNYYDYGVYFEKQDALLLIGNNIQGDGTGGMYLKYCDGSLLVSKNTIVNTGKYCIYMYYCDGSSSETGEVSNNIFRDCSRYGLYNKYGKYSNTYNNTISIDGDGAYSAFYLYNKNSYEGHTVHNNLFVNEGSGYAAKFYESGNIESCDNNNYYCPNGNLVQWDQSAVADLAALKLKDSYFNQNSVSIDPMFASSTDMYVFGNMDNLGLPIDTIKDDIYGTLRSLTTPDIGAIEFDFYAENVAINNIYGPSTLYCGNLLDSIWVDVRNYGTVIQDTIPFTAEITSPTGNVTTVVDTLFSQFDALAITSDLFLTTINTTDKGDYTVKVYTNLDVDGDVTNDTMTTVFTTSTFVASFPYAENFSAWPLDNWDMTGGVFDWSGNNDAAKADFQTNDTNNCIMMTPPIDLGAATLPVLQFSYSHEATTTKDSLAVQITTCGNAWSTVWAKGSTDLATTVGDYVAVELDIPAAFVGQEIFVRFNALSDNGTDLFIDDLLVAEYPVVNLPTDTATCVGEDMVLNAGSGANYSYNWTTISDATSIATTQLLTVSTPDTFVVTVTDNNSGLAVNDTVIFKNNPTPIAAISGSNPVYNFATTLNGSATNGIGTYKYYWSPASMIDGDTTSQNVNTMGITTPQYFTLTVVDSMPATACMDTAMIHIGYTGSALVVTPTTSNDTVCATSAATLSANSTEGGATHTWSWTSNPAGFTSTLENPVVNPTQGAWYIVEATDGANTDIDSVYVGVWDLPTVTASSDASICADDSAQISLSFTGEQPYSFDVFDGSTTTALTSATSVYSSYMSPTATTNYVLTTITDNNACVVSGNIDSVKITVNALPVVSLTALTDLCADVTSQTITGATPAGGNWTGNGVTNNDFDAATAGVGSHYLTYTYTDANSCTDIDSTIQVVNTIPVVSLGSDTTICEYNTYSLDAGNAGATYLWSTGATTQTITVDTTGFGIGNFNYTVSVTNANMCVATDAVEITYEATPVSQLTDTNSICGEDADITLDAGSVTGNTYLWNNGELTSVITIDTADLGATSGTMSVEITSEAGCVNNDATFVSFLEVPVVDLGDDQMVCINHEVILDAANAGATFLWNTGATTQTITVDSNTFVIGDNIFSVEVYNDVNCNATDSVKLVVDPCTGVAMPELANANIKVFPNPTTGKFQIEVTGLDNEEYSFNVFNSIGVEVYSAKVSADNNKQTWNLDFSNYATGVYYLRLHSNGDIKVKRIIVQ